MIFPFPFLQVSIKIISLLLEIRIELYIKLYLPVLIWEPNNSSVPWIKAFHFLLINKQHMRDMDMPPPLVEMQGEPVIPTRVTGKGNITVQSTLYWIEKLFQWWHTFSFTSDFRIAYLISIYFLFENKTRTQEWRRLITMSVPRTNVCIRFSMTPIPVDNTTMGYVYGNSTVYGRMLL